MQSIYRRPDKQENETSLSRWRPRRYMNSAPSFTDGEEAEEQRTINKMTYRRHTALCTSTTNYEDTNFTPFSFSFSYYYYHRRCFVELKSNFVFYQIPVHVKRKQCRSLPPGPDTNCFISTFVVVGPLANNFSVLSCLPFFSVVFIFFFCLSFSFLCVVFGPLHCAFA